MNIYQVVKRPLVTERTNDQVENGIYTFEVDRQANKGQISGSHLKTIFSRGLTGLCGGLTTPCAVHPAKHAREEDAVLLGVHIR